MIYEPLETTAPLRQGDIFVSLPRIDISLERVVVMGEDGERVASWKDLVDRNEQLSIVVPIQPVAAIVATQDCDATRSRDITLCEIRPFHLVDAKAKSATAPKSWKSILTQHARLNQKWFYLPPEPFIGFSEKMAVDFLVTLRVSRLDLTNLYTLRKGRLNEVANKHFRERIGEFFRRYPYDEWYALDKDELAEYQKEYLGIEPFPWQKS